MIFISYIFFQSTLHLYFQNIFWILNLCNYLTEYTLINLKGWLILKLVNKVLSATEVVQHKM